MAYPVPTKAFLQSSSDMAMNAVYTLQVHTPPPLSQPFCSHRAYISEGHCQSDIRSTVQAALQGLIRHHFDI